MGDEEVKRTADDSTMSKAYCCQLGYLADPYVRFFAHGGNKRPPIINRGYWARVNRVWLTLTRFLESSGPGAQIVSIGAGFDTNYWMLRDRFPQAQFSFVEMDFADVCAKKLAIISRHSELSAKIPVALDVKSDGYIGGEVMSDSYKLLSCDLRDTEGTLAKLRNCTNPEAPTFVFAECVLVYLDPQYSDALLRELVGTFANLGFLSYDIINPTDAFGREMIENLSTRGITLRGVHQYPSLAAHQHRLQVLFPRFEVRQMLDIYNNFTDQAERRR